MAASQLLLNLGILAFVLLTNLGTHPVTRRRFTIPLLLVAVGAAVFLNDIPTAGHDIALEMIGAAAGTALGIVAGLLVRVSRDASGQLVTQAGAAYAAVWVAVIGGRIGFAYGASHLFAAPVAHFSAAHHITGSAAWVAAFVLMALAMVLARLVVTGVRAAAAASASRTAAASRLLPDPSPPVSPAPGPPSQHRSPALPDAAGA